MPANGAVLGSLIQTNVNSKMTALSFGAAPLGQPNPSYFIAFCNAIGTGIANGGPVINFITNDSGLKGSPPVSGIGSGTGIVVDDSFFAQDLYIRTRAAIITQFGATSHQAYPPTPGNSGELLKALCEGIALSVKLHYSTAWILTSTHPAVYSGNGIINAGQFSGLIATAIEGAIMSAGPTMLGSFFPTLAKAISESYVETIHNHSTGSVIITGTCVPGSSQTCGISGSGNGSGVAT
jgi:hypothetical protein